MSEKELRPCAAGCGLPAEPGDVYCQGDRDVDRGGDATTVGGIAHDDGLT